MSSTSRSANLVTAAVAPGTTDNTIIKASSGRLVSILVTAEGTEQLLVYDNPSEANGTVIGIIPETAATVTSSPIVFNMPANRGITVQGGTNTPGVTILWG